MTSKHQGQINVLIFIGKGGRVCVMCCSHGTFKDDHDVDSDPDSDSGLLTLPRSRAATKRTRPETHDRKLVEGKKGRQVGI